MKKLQINTHQPFRLHDDANGNFLTTSDYTELHTYYTSACNNPNHAPVPPWDDPNNPRPLNIPITTEETSTAMLQIKNGKAPETNKEPEELLNIPKTSPHPSSATLSTQYLQHINQSPRSIQAEW